MLLEAAVLELAPAVEDAVWGCEVAVPEDAVPLDGCAPEEAGSPMEDPMPLADDAGDDVAPLLPGWANEDAPRLEDTTFTPPSAPPCSGLPLSGCPSPVPAPEQAVSPRTTRETHIHELVIRPS